jgi:RNA polymerase sigma-70 factor (ECF subfamily)
MSRLRSPIRNVKIGDPTRVAAANTFRLTMEKLSEASDAALVVAIGRWHQDALAEAYRRHAGAMCALAQRVLGQPAVAEEIVQEVFISVWNQPERFDPARGSLRSFLLSKVHGRAIDLLRSDTARRQREERDARRTAEAGYDLELEVWDLAVADRVKEALATLPDEERRAIALAYFNGHTYREVASLLGEPEGTVKSRIRAGLKRMRAQLADDGVGMP